MWFKQPTTDYISQMPWKRLDEPEVMSWQVRVRDYHTRLANWIFVGMVATTATFTAVMVALASMPPKSTTFIWLSIGAFFLFTPLGLTMTHQTSIIVYRLTDKGYEVFSWKPQIDSVKPVMKWASIITGIAVTGLIALEPMAVFGLAGPAGMGLMAMTMGNSSEYQSLMRGESYFSACWEEVEEVVLWRKRHLIGLWFTFYTEDGTKQDGYGILHCIKGEEEERVAFIRSKATAVPYVEKSIFLFEGGMGV